jgi:hypothetical protein
MLRKMILLVLSKKWIKGWNEDQDEGQTGTFIPQRHDGKTQSTNSNVEEHVIH